MPLPGPALISSRASRWGWAGLGWVLGGAAAVMVGRGMQALAHLCDGQGYKIIHEGAAAMVGRGMLALAHLCDEQGFIGL